MVADSYYLFGHQYDITAEGCYSNPANLINSMGNGSWNGSMMKNKQSPLCELNTYVDGSALALNRMLDLCPPPCCVSWEILLDMTGGHGASTRMLYTHSI